MNGWLFLAAMVVICTAVISLADRWMDRRPPFYQGRRRWPSTAHPAWRRARYLHMQRVDEAELSAAYDRCMADLDALLEQEAR